MKKLSMVVASLLILSFSAPVWACGGGKPKPSGQEKPDESKPKPKPSA